VISKYDLEIIISDHGYLKPRCAKRALIGLSGRPAGRTAGCEGSHFLGARSWQQKRRASTKFSPQNAHFQKAFAHCQINIIKKNPGDFLDGTVWCEGSYN